MEKNLELARAEVDQDLSPAWIDLCTSLRRSAAELQRKAGSSDLGADATAVSVEANRLCDHVERLHRDVQELLDNLEARLPTELPDFTTPADRPDSNKVKEEAIKIQREAHELRADFKDVLKALFMWRDDPAERVSGRDE